MKYDPKNIAPRLKALLKTLDMNQTELAERCGITQAAVSQVINGERTPSLETLCRILEVIPVKFETLAAQANDQEKK